MLWYDWIFWVICVIIIILSLLQGGKSEGASGAITGGGLNVFVKTKERGSELIVSYLTLAFGIVFLFLALLSSVLTGTSGGTDTGTGDSGETTTQALSAIVNFVSTIL